MKTIKLILSLLCLAFPVLSFAQQDNLVHTSGYKTSEYGAMVSYSKEGRGKADLILIPGLGFEGSVFTDFIQRNKKNFTMYVVTLPGFGNTSAPPMPDSANASYGRQYWSNAAVEGIRKLAAKEHLRKPIVVGHFVLGAQLALRLAIDFPELVGGVVTVGAPAKFISIMNGVASEYPLQSTINYIDKYTGPNWFGPMPKAKFDQGNYLPEVYSLDPGMGNPLWRMSADVPLPVYVRYLCEFFASDITLEANKIHCPVMVLRAMFTPAILNVDVNNYIKPQFIESWERMAKSNPFIVLQDFDNSAAFIWKDQPAKFDEVITDFVSLSRKNGKHDRTRTH